MKDELFNDLIESIKSLPTHVLREMERNMKEEMKYTITYKEKEQQFEMNGVIADFVGDHLKWIAKKHDVHVWYSESYLLSCLRDKGVEIELLEEDGSRMVW